MSVKSTLDNIDLIAARLRIWAVSLFSLLATFEALDIFGAFNDFIPPGSRWHKVIALVAILVARYTHSKQSATAVIETKGTARERSTPTNPMGVVPLAALALVALAFVACAPVEDEEPVTPTESAAIFPDYNAMADYAWSYYTGNFTGARPSMIMRQPDKACSPLSLGGGLYAYRRPRVAGICIDSGSQSTAVPYNFSATFEVWQDHVPLQQPWYATSAINFLCTAAYERAGFSYDQAYPYCNGSASSTVPTVRHLVHDVYNAGEPFWAAGG